ncbi:MAG: pyridoxamine 5'-phosphate oxidase [Chromatiales bacterium]|jgi:nitroimidazol reductase NimA-like FMN-containing flavoprotein (pyridoxamine 5'-phosphate oxidase superfamily)|nr:pyridoxamine 5'-phosphate oxidase [Chromatiales bacterium]MDP6150027.1 pyridoxamine 5'-phosphate oxidase family protein [Gammaproteobacteria bacterium]MDP7093380.1 pyridoxamine 5'-phosphate oxidase family protein [Gammaproteobacteria bacterium]MDP7271979.1 pyridoxamine 5'-phosphate oxidase family protein [Gammaproteobacteria bacterium]HJP03992.1 pyridoxamine 5'-phosphate oxidase family protein [Gammaproteobacteria bacterium]
MSTAHKWLEEEPWPTKAMPKEMLEKRIERVLTMTNIGYLGTVRKDGSPIVSPLEFYNDGFSLYLFPQPKSPKVYAIKRDPRVCIAIANPMAGWACVMGCQIFGTATLLDVDTPEWVHGMKIFKWAGSSSELGRQLEIPPQGQLARIDPDRIVYSEHLMRKEGYAPRQIWTADDAELKVVPGANV